MKTLGISKLNKIRIKLKNSKPTIGTWQQIPDPSISEILANAGYDWIAIDLEHGAINLNQLPNLFRAIEVSDCFPFARVSEPTQISCRQSLDAGAKGIIIPMIENSNQLEKLIASCCYPPKGNRGVGYTRSNIYGKNFDESIKENNPLIIAQIENINAVNNINEILLVDGLDAVIIGPYDLSASIDRTGEFSSAEYVSLIKKIREACIKNNIPYGCHIVQPYPKVLLEEIKQGSQFIAYGTDGVFLNQSSQIPDLDYE